MTTAVIGTGALGSVIARLLASGGETPRLSSADRDSVRKLAGEIGRAALAAADNSEAPQGADAVILALRFTALEGVIDELAGRWPRNSSSFPAIPLGWTRTETSDACSRRGSPPARSWPGGYPQDRLRDGVWNPLG